MEAGGPEEVRGAVTSRPTSASTRSGWRSTPLGFDEIYLHHVGQEQTAFIDAFGSKVLPELRKA